MRIERAEHFGNRESIIYGDDKPSFMGSARVSCDKNGTPIFSWYGTSNRTIEETQQFIDAVVAATSEANAMINGTWRADSI